MGSAMKLGPGYLFLIAIIFGLATAMIAYRKGHSAIGWFSFGILFFIVAFPWVLLLKKDRDMLARRNLRNAGLKKCKSCGSTMPGNATICTACGRDHSLSQQQYLATISSDSNGSGSATSQVAPPHPLDRYWEINVDDKSYGPYDGHQLKRFLEEGRINDETAVKKPGGEYWIKLSEDKLLASLMS